jgi:predicted nucleic acid-binding Zn ribbon protein
MNPLNSCPRCGRPSPAGVKFCAACGSNLSSSSSSSGKGWKLLFGAFALFAGLVWAAVVITRTQPAAQLAGSAQPQALLAQGATPSATLTTSPSLALTSSQHLSEAKRALADGYKPNRDPQKTQWGEVAPAKWHLKAIGATASEYREAQEMLKEVARRERQIELAKKQAEKDADSEGEAAEEADDDSAEPSSAAVSSPTYSGSPDSARQSSPPASEVGRGSSDDYYTNSRGTQVHRPVYSDSGPPAGATAQCRDGSYSFSQSRSGTCSHHGGVARWL